MSEFAVIAGLSGAGRSQAADFLEDLGWFVVDNVPPALIPKLAELANDPESTTERVALVMRSGDYEEELRPALDALSSTDRRVRILFLDAATETLVRRYEGTRRRHPLGGGDLAGDIEREREMLGPLRARADVVLDTTDLNVHQLRAWVVELFADEAHPGLQISVVSFGYKHGLPRDIDMVFDCRFLPNPHWVDDLRPLTGRDEPVRDYVLGQPNSGPFLAETLDRLFGLLLPAYLEEGKAYLRIGFGCTGGRHRSVAMAEEVARRLHEGGFDPSVAHRDVER